MWPKVAGALIIGYLCFGRTFSYLGIPPWKVFVGEFVLALLLLWGPKLNGRPWLWVGSKLPELRTFSKCYGLFLGYGVLQVLRGIWMGNPPLTAFRDLAFNYYPIYFALGLWAGLRRPDLLPNLIRYFAWFNGVYGVLYLFLLNRVEWYVPGVGEDIAAVPLFAQPIYSTVALLGLLAYEKKAKRSWHLILLNALVLFGMQIRTEWLAFATGTLMWCLVTGKGKRVLQAIMILVALVCVMYVTDFSLPSPKLRAEGQVSSRQLLDRALAPFRADLTDEEAAAGLSATESVEATLVWRTVWWLSIWDSVHGDLKTTIWGYGYGFPLGDLVPYLEGQFIRTPHNQFFYALGYTGWLGVALFALFQAQIVRLLRSRTVGEPFGLVFWMAMMTYGMFFPLGETPYGAIPFYLITGWIAAQALPDNQMARNRKNLAKRDQLRDSVTFVRPSRSLDPR